MLTATVSRLCNQMRTSTPLYVLQALSCDESKDDRDVLRDVLSEDDFRSLSTERAVIELQALGVQLQDPASSILTLFPEGDARLRSYVKDTTPKLDLTVISMEDVLCHIRIVGNRLYRFGVRRKDQSKQLSLLHRRHRAGLGLSIDT